MSSRGGDALTTIPLRKVTRDRLRRFGGKGETYDTILNRLMDGPKGLPAGSAREPPKALVDFEPVDES